LVSMGRVVSHIIREWDTYTTCGITAGSGYELCSLLRIHGAADSWQRVRAGYPRETVFKKNLRFTRIFRNTSPHVGGHFDAINLKIRCQTGNRITEVVPRQILRLLVSLRLYYILFLDLAIGGIRLAGCGIAGSGPARCICSTYLANLGSCLQVRGYCYVGE
jgi:hypothetical protein